MGRVRRCSQHFITPAHLILPQAREEDTKTSAILQKKMPGVGGWAERPGGSRARSFRGAAWRVPQGLGTGAPWWLPDSTEFAQHTLQRWQVGWRLTYRQARGRENARSVLGGWARPRGWKGTRLPFPLGGKTGPQEFAQVRQVGCCWTSGDPRPPSGTTPADRALRGAAGRRPRVCGLGAARLRLASHSANGYPARSPRPPAGAVLSPSLLPPPPSGGRPTSRLPGGTPEGECRLHTHSYSHTTAHEPGEKAGAELSSRRKDVDDFVLGRRGLRGSGWTSFHLGILPVPTWGLELGCPGHDGGRACLGNPSQRVGGRKGKNL